VRVYTYKSLFLSPFFSNYNGNSEGEPVNPNQERDGSFLREWTIPEEERAKYTTTQTGDTAYRWFKSPNIVCLEHYRKKAESMPKPSSG
jgi:hypothetical protein